MMIMSTTVWFLLGGVGVLLLLVWQFVWLVRSGRLRYSRYNLMPDSEFGRISWKELLLGNYPSYQAEAEQVGLNATQSPLDRR
jgi:hypothetical protein